MNSFFGVSALARCLKSGSELEKTTTRCCEDHCLIEAQKWFDQRSQDLSDQERKFISASRELRERLAREEKERQKRELETARELAGARERAERSRKTREWKERTCSRKQRSEQRAEGSRLEAAAPGNWGRSGAAV